ncbi:MBL fold metallo-hydrolase [Zobellella endophytica]|nr:MBL fold metallo-hydrolase [Zobellella endophytica]
MEVNAMSFFVKKINLVAICIIGLTSPNIHAIEEDQNKENIKNEKTELVILGSSAGRTSWGAHPFSGTSSAIVVGDDRYIIDFGRGWHERYYEAGLGTEKSSTGFGGLENIKAAFITHLHADHVVDYPRLLLFGSTEGLRKRKDPIQIFGPGNRGGLPPTSSKIEEEADTVNPENPTPGTIEMTQYLYNAFATDLNDNIHDSGMPNPNKYISVNEIVVPSDVNASQTNPSPRMSPFEVYEDENIRVTATLVSHPPMYPSFAFRVDTESGSIVFSGDTNRNENLIELAKDADILVHEVISVEWANNLFPEPRSAAEEAKLDHLIKSHTPVTEVGGIAQEANVKHLVLSHLAPPTLSKEEWISQISGFDGKADIGSPLFRIALPLQH